MHLHPFQARDLGEHATPAILVEFVSVVAGAMIAAVFILTDLLAAAIVP